jgi:O-antigen/teichoic acid export membrane protein
MAVAALATTFGALGQAELHAADFREGSANRSLRVMTAIGGALVTSVIAYFLLVGWLAVPTGAAIAAVALVPAGVTVGLWRAEYIASGRLLIPSAVNAGTAFLRLGVLILLSLLSLLSLSSALWATQGAVAAGALVLWWLAKPLPVPPSIPGSAPSEAAGWKRPAQILTFAAFTAILLRSDVLVLQLTSSPGQVGLYAAAVGLSEAFLALSAGFKARLQASIYGQGSRKRLVREVAILHAILLPMLLGIAALASPIVVVLFGSAFAPAADILRILMVAAYFQVLMDCGTGVLVVLGKRKALVLASLTGAIVALATLLPLTTWFGAGGAAWSSAVAYASVAAVAWCTVFRSQGSGASRSI